MFDSNNRTPRNGSKSELGNTELFQPLEPRVLLSATFVGGVLDIAGDGADNAIVVSAGTSGSQIVISGVPGEADGTTFDGVTAINILAGDGDDDVSVDADITAPISVDGQSGSNGLIVEGSDTAGDDLKVKGGRKEQAGLILIASPKLTVFDLEAENVRDLTLNGNGGNDKIKIGQLSRTSLAGASIEINGGDGNDHLGGGRKVGASLVLFGEDGNDRLIGGELPDFIDGGAGNDRAKGNDGGDLIFGGFGDDKLFGGDGSDEIEGGFGSDRLNGGKGRDIVSYRSSGSSVLVNLGARKAFSDGNGSIDLTVVRFEVVDGSDNPDTLIGDGRNNTLNGYAGADLLKGLNGDDFLNAGFEDLSIDTLDGGNGQNILFNCEDPVEEVIADPEAGIVGVPAYDGDKCIGLDDLDV